MANVKVLVLNKAHQIIQQSNFNDKDNLYYILYVLNQQTNKHKYKNDDIGDDKGYVYIPNSYFNSILDNTSIQNSKQFLINNKIMDCDNIYNNDPQKGDIKSLGYKYNNSMYDLFTEWVIVELGDNLSSKVVKGIIGNKVRSKTKKINKVNDNYKPLHNRHKLFSAHKHFIDTFDIDEVKALKHIENDFQLDYQEVYDYFFIQGLFFFDKRHYNHSSECRYTFTKINQPQEYKYSLSFIDDREDMFNDLSSGAVDSNNLLNNELNNLMEFKTENNNSNSYINVSKFNQTPSIINTSRRSSRKLFTDFETEKKKIIKRKLHRQSKIKSIKIRKYFRQNNTNGRVDTNLTILPKRYKQYIISPKRLVSIDISNSQPYFLSLFLDKVNDGSIDKNELNIYIDVCRRGRLYETIVNKTKQNRDDIKQQIIERLFQLKIYNDAFRNTFPSILKYLDKYKRQITNSKFAIDVQTLESNLCINRIVTKLFENNVPCYTIHDSWLVYEEDVDKALDIIKSMFMDEYNSIPNFKIEPIN
jgi:hypothetical protein